VNHAALVPLTRDDLIALILTQQAQIEAQARHLAALTARIADLEAKLANPPKTPDNSSLPPSKGQKPNLPEPGKKKPRPRRPGVARALAEHPDKTIAATLAACPHCDHALSPADMTDIHAYDHIDLPPIRPIVTRINCHRGVCPCCRQPVSASASEGFEPGSPFGPGIAALIIHLHITQAVSFERLARLMDEVFGLSISEGAIANILARAQTPLGAAAETIAAAVRASPVVGSDETSARVRGKTWWQWVLLSSTTICHVIADTRAPRWRGRSCRAQSPMCGSRTATAASWVTAQCGKCVLHICYVMRTTPSRLAMRCSPRRSSRCCCGPWPLANGARR
jgi:transposase